MSESYTIDSVLKDMFKICFIGVLRGTNFEGKSWKKSTEEFLTEWEDLEEAYNIKKDAKGASASDLTIGRIMAVFPEFVMALLGLGYGKSPVGEHELPHVFRFSGAPSLMSEEMWDTYKNQYLDYMVKFSLIVSRNDRNAERDPLKVKQTQESIAMTQRNLDWNAKRWKTAITRCLKTMTTVPTANTELGAFSIDIVSKLAAGRFTNVVKTPAKKTSGAAKTVVRPKKENKSGS